MHIGQRIRQIYDAQPRQCSAGWLAARLHTDRTNVYNIFQRHDIDTGLLRRLSQILNHDFFADLSLALPTDEVDDNDVTVAENGEMLFADGRASLMVEPIPNSAHQHADNQRVRV